VVHRTVSAVRFHALLLDLREAVTHHPALRHPHDYAVCQALGARLVPEGRPWVVAPSVYATLGENLALFTPSVLAAPPEVQRLDYTLTDGALLVDRVG
jgi:hypothetical protein